MKIKGADGWTLFEALGTVIWAGLVVVEDPEDFGLVVVLELELPGLVDSPVEVAEGGDMTDGIGGLVLIGMVTCELAETWLVTLTTDVGVVSVI